MSEKPYSKLKKLSATPRAELFLLKSSEGKLVVGKKFKNNESSAFLDTMMVKKINELGIPHVLQYIDSFPTKNHYFLLTEYYENGSLYEQILKRELANENTTKEEILRHSYSMIETLSQLHANNIVHRDIKPHNIFVDRDFELKLGDFGEAKILYPESSHSLRGTYNYMPPELLNKEHIEDLDSFRQDIWGLGRTLFELCSCSLCPYVNGLDQQSINEFTTSTLKDKGLPDDYVQLILRMLTRDKAERITADNAFTVIKDIYHREQPLCAPEAAESPVVLCQGCQRPIADSDKVNCDCEKCWYHKDCFVQFTGPSIVKAHSIEEVRCQCGEVITGATLERVTHPDNTQLQKLFLILRSTHLSCIQCGAAIDGFMTLDRNNHCYKVKCPQDKVTFCSLCGYRGGHKKCPEYTNMVHRYTSFD